MSFGFCGFAHLIQRDDSLLLYTYCCYNVNLENWQEMKQMEDGEIWIEPDALVEPVIHRKRVRLPSGRRKIIEKRIQVEVPYEELLNTHQITVRNASGTWNTDEAGIDFVAWHLIRRVFEDYQIAQTVPESVAWLV